MRNELVRDDVGITEFVECSRPPRPRYDSDTIWTKNRKARCAHPHHVELVRPSRDHGMSWSSL
jgi:hypothetical protein